MQELTEQFHRYEPALAAVQLILAMIGMGATLSWADFENIFRRPGAVLLVLCLQFLVIPLVVVAVGLTGIVPHEVLLGLYLLVSLPSGAQSNVFTFLGRGDVPLSITATCASTVICLLLTPLLLRLLWSFALPGDFAMPVGSIVACLVWQMLLPLGLGMLLGRWRHQQRMAIARGFVQVSLAVLAVIIVGAFATGQLAVGRYGWIAPVVIIALVIFSSVVTKLLTRASGYDHRQRFTIAVEVTLRNGPLGIALCGILFSATGPEEPLYAASLYVCLLASGAMLVTAGVAVVRRLRFADLRLRDHQPTQEAGGTPPPD
jgi:bile acid:Na+ symporter, BASS family